MAVLVSSSQATTDGSSGHTAEAFRLCFQFGRKGGGEERERRD
jgi:hypothetical protein